MSEAKYFFPPETDNPDIENQAFQGMGMDHSITNPDSEPSSGWQIFLIAG